jgi:tetratricopeptide (TPR) repeat protein
MSSDERSIEAEQVQPGAIFADLRVRRAQLIERLRSDGATSELAALKAEIIALFREADANATAFAALRDDVRALVAEWKALEQRVPVSPPATLRVDHLGASTFIEKGWSALSMGDAAAAETALHRARELSPADAQALTLLAWAQVHQRKFADARATLDAVQVAAPEFTLAQVVEGLLALRQADLDRAVQLFRATLEDTAADRRAVLYAHLYLGVALREAGAHADSVDVLVRALELGPNMLEAALELGHTQRMTGDEMGALATWRHAATANKFSPWGKRCAELVAMYERGELAVGHSSTG